MNYSPEERKQIQNMVEDVYNLLKESLGDRIERFDIAGSFSKHTEVRGLSDVDVQLTLGKEYTDYTPLQVRRILKKVLRDKIKGARIHNGDLALTIRYKGMDIQLIPVLPDEGGKVRIPKNDTSWSEPTNQRIFRKKLQNLCKVYRSDPRDKVYRVLKVIRAMKAIESKRPPDRRLPGYYVENTVYNALRDGQCKPDATSGELLRHCYEYASKQILCKTPEMSGQTRYVDSCLNNWQLRNRVALSEQSTRTAD